MHSTSKKDLSLLNVISLGIGSIVGAGIFALLGQVILLAGDHTYHAFFIAGIAAVFSGYSYAKLAGRYHSSGGLTDYFHIAFPEKYVSGTLSAIYLVTEAISISMIAKAFGIYITELFNQIPPSDLWVNTLAAVLIIGLALLNMMQASDVGRSETVIVIIKVAILFALVFAALFQPGAGLHPPAFSGESMDFLRSIGVTFFAYAGYGVITNATSDVKKPQQTIEWAIYLTLFIVMALYISLAWVVLNYIPTAELEANAETSVAEVARKLLGTAGYGFIYVAAVLAFVSGINATFFSIFRISDSLTQQTVFPHFMLKKFWRQGSLGAALNTLLIVLVTIFFDFSSIVNLSSAAYLVSYLGIFIANWKLRKETKSNPAVIIVGTLLMVFILAAFIISILPR